MSIALRSSLSITLHIVCLVGAACNHPAVLYAQSATERTFAGPPAAQLINPPTQRAISRGLAFLASRQVRSGSRQGGFGQSGYAGGVAVCGLSGLAFMCGGNPPGRGPYGRQVDDCIEFILRHSNDVGYIAVAGSQDNMYGHGFATLFLAETYGMSLDQRVAGQLRKAVKLIVDCQNSQGGWRYQPQKSDADLSITICQIMALRAARDAGIHVPEEVREKCLRYVRQSQNDDGGFRYQVQGGGSTFPLTAAGLVSLYSAGIYDGPEVQRGLKHLMRFRPGKRAKASHYFYGHYYAVQATWHARGDYWRQWYPAIRDELLSQQEPNGAWRERRIGREFATAMACIILQMPNNYLPVFSP